MSNDPKNVQLNGVFHQNIIPTSHQNIQEVPMDEEKPQKSEIDPQNSSHASILSTMGSVESLNQQELLDVSSGSENTKLNFQEVIKISKFKEKNKNYSFTKEYLDEVYQNLLLDEQNLVFLSLNRNFETMPRTYFRSEKKRKTSFSFAFLSLNRNFEAMPRNYFRSEILK